MNNLCFGQFARFLLVIFSFVVIYFFIKQTIIIWYPLIIVVCLTLLCYPITNFLVLKLRLPHLIASITTVCLIFSMLMIIVFWITLEFFKSVTYFINLFSRHFEHLLLTLENFFENNIWQMYKSYLTENQQQLIEQQLHQMVGQLSELSLSLLQNIAFKMMKLLGVFPYSIMILLFILMATILMTNDWPLIKEKFTKMIPQTINHSRVNVMNNFKKLFINYLQAQMIIATITALVLWIGLTLLKVEHALTIVIVTAIVDLLPVVGTGLIFIPWIIYLFIIGNYSLTIKLALLYGAVVILRQLIEPKIVSAKIGIRPLTVLISLFLSIQIFGAVGLILAPLIIIFGHALYQADVHRQLWQFIKG